MNPAWLGLFGLKVILQVIEEVDRGEPLVTEEVPMEHPRDDELNDFEERMHQVEHSLIVKGVGVAIERLLSVTKT